MVSNELLEYTPAADDAKLVESRTDTVKPLLQELKPLKLIILPLLVGLSFLGRPVFAGQSAFDEGDISSLVKFAESHKSVSSKRLVKLVKELGINFEPAESYFEGLRREGANEALLKALRSAKKVDQPGSGMQPAISVYVVGPPSPLVPIYKPEPPYSDNARRAKVDGVLVLWVVIGPSGNVIDIKEVSDPLGEGLDKGAIRIVSTWKFEPPTRNGTPVAVHTAIEVSFRTL